MKHIYTYLILSTLFSATAQAELVCRNYTASGERNITQICVEKISDGIYKYPRLIDAHGMDWPIAPGVSAKVTANKICKKLEMASVLQYQVGQCSSEQATVNLRGNYAFAWNFKCIEQVSCSPN